VELGIGPVCRGKTIKQGELDFMFDEQKEKSGASGGNKKHGEKHGKRNKR
jgi:Zn-finger nucleic acid-binding protein